MKVQYSTASKVHSRMSIFRQWIAPEKETRQAIKDQSDEFRDRIKTKAEEDGLTVTDTPRGGSFSTQTGLRRHLRGEMAVDGQDVDVPFVVKRDKETEFAPLVQRFAGYVRVSYPTTKDIVLTKSSVRVTFSGTTQSYDLVPMFATAVPDRQILIRDNGDQIETSVQKHRRFIKSRTEETKAMAGVVAFNEMIRLLKWWREHKQQKTSGIIDVPSFLLNLLAAAALRECGVHTTYPQTLAKWFAFLAHTVQEKKTIWFDDFYRTPVIDNTKAWNVIDPVMPANNIVAGWSGWQVSELADWFRDGSETMNRVIAADMVGRDSDSLTYLQALFGKIFSSHCEK
jgi:hypothetical protein